MWSCLEYGFGNRGTLSYTIEPSAKRNEAALAMVGGLGALVRDGRSASASR